MSYYNTSGPSAHKYIDTSQPVWGIRTGMGSVSWRAKLPAHKGNPYNNNPYNDKGQYAGLGCGPGSPPGVKSLGCGVRMDGVGDSASLPENLEPTWAPSGFEYRNAFWWSQFVSKALAQQVVTVADLQGGYFCTPSPAGFGGEMNGYGAVQTWAAAGWFVLHQYQGQKCVDGSATAVIRVAPLDIGKWRGVPGVRILAMPGNAPSTQTEWAKYGYYDTPSPSQPQPSVPAPPVVIPTLPTVQLCPDGSFPDPFTMQCKGSSTPVIPPPQVQVSASVEAPWKTILFVGIVAACVIGVAKVSRGSAQYHVTTRPWNRSYGYLGASDHYPATTLKDF